MFPLNTLGLPEELWEVPLWLKLFFFAELSGTWIFLPSLNACFYDSALCLIPYSPVSLSDCL